MKTKLPPLKQQILVHKDIDQYQKDLDLIEERILPRFGELNHSWFVCIYVHNLTPGAIRILKENYPIRVYKNRSGVYVFRNWFYKLISYRMDILLISITSISFASAIGPTIAAMMTGHWWLIFLTFLCPFVIGLCSCVFENIYEESDFK